MKSTDMTNQTKAYRDFAWLRSGLFRLDPEKVHHFIFKTMKSMSCLPGFKPFLKACYLRHPAGLSQMVGGVKFPSPIGLAAGFDKDADLLNLHQALGFGFAEVGTVTLKAQDGNPKPRMFREHLEGALINRMGFNNGGVEMMIRRFEAFPHRPIPIGINIGKNKTTPNESAVQEYREVLTQVYPHADYIVVNVSSPNTPGLRDLQSPDSLYPLLKTLRETVDRLAIKNGEAPKPLLVKLAPEVTDSALVDVLALVRELNIDGVVATNTLKTSEGGKSGKPLTEISRDRVYQIRKYLGEKAFIIGVGGIFSPEDATEMLLAGANLAQVYTGWIYKGPTLIKRIHQHLNREMRLKGFKELSSWLVTAHQAPKLEPTAVEQVI